MDPIQFGGPVFNQSLAIARQIAKLPDRPGWNEAPLNEPVAQGLGNPLAIFHIRFPSRNIFDMPGVGQENFHALFQDI
jgi:hypothetical protein